MFMYLKMWLSIRVSLVIHLLSFPLLRLQRMKTKIDCSFIMDYDVSIILNVAFFFLLFDMHSIVV